MIRQCTTSIASKVCLLALLALIAMPLAGAGCAASHSQTPATRADAGHKPTSLDVYVGTYTNAKSKGIYLLHMDLATGALESAGVAAAVPSPSFLAIAPNQKFLYAVNEVSNFGGEKSGAVSALAIDDRTGKLTLLNQRPTKGGGPCHLVVDKTGGNVIVANYGGGSTTVVPITADGKLAAPSAFIQHTGTSVNPQRQEAPHAHCVALDAANRLAFVADLGLDKVLIYRFDAAKGTLAPNNPPAGVVKPGSGPRHFAIHPNGRFAYVISEMASTVTAFNYDAATGALSAMQTVATLPAGFTGNSSTAELEIHPSGKFLYGSNRGHDSIVAFAIDQQTGKLTYIEHESTRGKTPRSFAIDPTGKYLLAANQSTDSVVVFAIDPNTGALSFTGHEIQVPTPVCLKMIAH